MKKSTSLICIFGAVSLATFASACSGTEDDGTVITSGAGGGTVEGAGGSGATTGGTLFEGTGTWVAGDANTVGVQGSFFVLEDSMKDGVPVDDLLQHTDLSPDEFDDATPKPCVSGKVAKVTASDGVTECGYGATDEECDFGTWGGGIGMNLNETGGDASVQSTWDATAHGVTGFSFDVSFGGFTGKDVRFKATMDGSDQDFCIKIPKEGPNSVVLADLKHECWDAAGGPETLDVTKLKQLQWQLVTEAGNEFTVENFCVNNVSWF